MPKGSRKSRYEYELKHDISQTSNIKEYRLVFELVILGAPTYASGGDDTLARIISNL